MFSRGKQSHTTTFAGDASQRNYNADILLDDLQPAQRNNRVVLNMDDDSQRYFEGPDIDKGDAKSLTAEVKICPERVKYTNGLKAATHHSKWKLYPSRSRKICACGILI